MILTGGNLTLVRRGIELALGELHNQIGTCPDVWEYAEEIEALEAEQRQFGQLLARIDRAIARERKRDST